MHELVSDENTEHQLKETCVQVGEHLYIRPSREINSEFLKSHRVGENKENPQIVCSMGGSGTRLRHITKDEYSKHLIDVGGKPISRYVFDLWLSRGFEDFCFLIDDTHRGKSIVDYYGDGKKFGANVKYSIEHCKLAAGGAIRLAIENGTITKPFINHFPDDIIINYPNFVNDFEKIFVAAIELGYQCVIVCVPGMLYQYGVVEDKNGDVVDFIEKPFIEKDTNIGVFGLSEDAFPLILQLEPNKEIKIERTVLKQIAQSGKMLKVLLPTEYWIPVNDEPNLSKLAEIVRSKK